MNYEQLNYKLLDHSFYQSWNRGEITRTQLSQYAHSYLLFIEELPQLWSKIFQSFNLETQWHSIVDEEIEHIELWNIFKNKLDKQSSFPSLQKLVDILYSLSPSELAWAIHAFEVQQPEVSVSKKQGLLDHYGMTEKDTVYFDEHMSETEEKHIRFWKLIESKSCKSEFESGFQKWSEFFYKALDVFLIDRETVAC